MKQKNKGCLYWDESSRGYHGNEGHTPYKRGRWVAEKRIDGRLVRKRSTDMQKCLDFLNDCDEIASIPRGFGSVERIPSKPLLF